jgi:ribose transport system permease protein
MEVGCQIDRGRTHVEDLVAPAAGGNVNPSGGTTTNEGEAAPPVTPASAADQLDPSGGGRPAAAAEGRAGWLPLLGRLSNRYGIVLAWALLVLIYGILEPDTFLTFGNLNAILSTEAVLLILALGTLVPLTVGEFDLSVAGTMGLAYVLLGVLTLQHHWPFPLALAACLVAGLLVGAVNAFFVVVVGVESIIVTLGSGTVLLGLGYALLVSPLVGLSTAYSQVINFPILGIPFRFYLALLLAAVTWYVFEFTPLGRYMFFVGVNRAVARLAGIPVTGIRIGALLCSGLVAALAGLILSGATGAADASSSGSYLLPAFAAIFLGATTINPGRFNAWGTVVAVYFLTTGITGLELKGLTGWVEQVFYGCALVLAVALSRLAGRTTGGFA